MPPRCVLGGSRRDDQGRSERNYESELEPHVGLLSNPNKRKRHSFKIHQLKAALGPAKTPLPPETLMVNSVAGCFSVRAISHEHWRFSSCWDSCTCRTCARATALPVILQPRATPPARRAPLSFRSKTRHELPRHLATALAPATRISRARSKCASIRRSDRRRSPRPQPFQASRHRQTTSITLLRTSPSGSG